MTLKFRPRLKLLARLGPEVPYSLTYLHGCVCKCICGNVWECVSMNVWVWTLVCIHELYTCMCLCVFMCTCVYMCAEFVWLKKLFISVWHTTNWSYVVRTSPYAPGTYNQSISLLVSPSPFFAFWALTMEQALNREGDVVKPLAYDPHSAPYITSAATDPHSSNHSKALYFHFLRETPELTNCLKSEWRYNLGLYWTTSCSTFIGW